MPAASTGINMDLRRSFLCEVKHASYYGQWLVLCLHSYLMPTWAKVTNPNTGEHEIPEIRELVNDNERHLQA